MTRWALVLGLFAAGCVFKPHHKALVPTGNSVPFKAFTYPTGLRVVAEQHSGSKRVAVAIRVAAGAADDAPGKEGTAHFVEHLAFRSRPVNRLQMWDELDFAGVASVGSAMANAQTSLDSTTYSGVVPAERTGEVLPLLASLVVRPLNGVDAATVEVERSVLRNEYLERNPHGGGALLAKLGELAFGENSRPARPISGDPKTLTTITPSDLESFVKTWYRPEAVTVVLVGDLELEKVDALVRRAFPAAWLDATGTTEPFHRINTASESVPAPNVRPVLEMGVSRRQLIFVWSVPGPRSAATPVMPLVADAFARRVRREFLRDPAITGVFGDFIPGLFGSMVTLTISLAPGAPLEATRDRVRAMKNFSWDVDRSEEQANSFERFSDRQNLLLHAEARAQEISWQIPTSLMVSEKGWDEVARLRREVLIWPRAKELLLVPRVVGTELSPLPPAPASQAKNIVVEPERLAAAAIPVTLPDARSYTLPNGLQVVISRRLPVPVVSVTLAVPTGSRHGTRLVTALGPAALDWNRDQRLDFFLAGTPTIHIAPDVTTFSLTSQAWMLPVMLDVLGHNLPPELSRSSLWTADAILSQLRRNSRSASQEEEDDEDRPLRERVMPPGSVTMPLQLEETKDVGEGQFARFFGQAFEARGAVLFIDGDVDVEGTKVIVNELFASWSAGSGKKSKLRDLGQLPKKPKLVKVVDSPDAAQTSVTVMCRLPPATSVEVRGGQALLADALATSFEDELRRSRGLTYGVFSSVTEFAAEDNLLVLRTNLDAREKQRGLTQFFAKLDSLDGAVWEEPVVDLARWRLAKRHLGSQMTSQNISLTLSEEMVRGATLEQAAAMPRALATVPLKWVDEAWNACSDTLAIEVRGQKSSIDAALGKRAE